MRITIIGAGNGGQALAAHLTLLGHEITLFARNQQLVNLLRRNNEITLIGKIQGNAKIACITNNLEEAVGSSEIIFVATTADAHAELAAKMAQYLNNKHLIVLNPGRTLGALEFRKVLAENGISGISIAETESLVYVCRLNNENGVNIFGVKKSVHFALLPDKNHNEKCSIIESILPMFKRSPSILHTGFENYGAMIHPAITLFSAASIERHDPFSFYQDITPAVAEFIEKLDQERLKTGEAFDINLVPLSDWLSSIYNGGNKNTLDQQVKNNPAYKNIPAPVSLYSRFITEDIPTGIVPLSELGQIAGVETPLMDSLINISSALLDRNFRKTGRTLTNLGLHGYAVSDIRAMVDCGVYS